MRSRIQYAVIFEVYWCRVTHAVRLVIREVHLIITTLKCIIQCKVGLLVSLAAVPAALGMPLDLEVVQDLGDKVQANVYRVDILKLQPLALHVDLHHAAVHNMLL
jgi:hypothetical protein